MGSSEENKSRVPVSPSLWLVTLARQLRRAAARVHTIEAEAGPARERARDWLGKTATRAKSTAGVAATKTAVVLTPVAKEANRGLRLLRRRARHTAALVSIPWLKVGAAAAVLFGIGFVAFQPRGEPGHAPVVRSQKAARGETDPKAATTTLVAPITNSRTVAAQGSVQPQKQTVPRKQAVATEPAKRQISGTRRNLERRGQAHSKQGEKWHKKHGKRKKDDDDD